MAHANPPQVFRTKPVVTAIALMLTGTTVVMAEEAHTLPEVKVDAKKDVDKGYKVERASSSKFTAPLIDTPKSVTVITEDVIRDTGSVTFQEALRTAPGITFGTGEGGGPIGDRPFIRGFDAQSAIFVDGLRDVGAQTREVFAIEQIEVLKGPSGAFDGRGSAGGSINIVTKKPKADNFVAGSVGLGTDSYRRGTADVNYAISEDVAVRVNAMAHAADTPGRDDVDVRRFGFAPSISLGMNSRTKATLSYYHFQTDDMPDRGLMYNDTANPVGKPLSVSRDNFYGIKNRDYQETAVDIGTAEISHAFSDTTVVRNTTRYGVSKNEYVVSRPSSAASLLATGRVNRTAQGRDTKTTSVMNLTDVSFAFATSTLQHKVNTGIEISREETRNYGLTVTNGNLIGDLYNPNPNDVWVGTISRPAGPGTTTTSVNKSIYAFDSINLSEKWIVNAGVRYDKFDVESENATTRLDSRHGFFNYQAGLVYKVQPNGSVYVNYATSSTPVGLANGDGNHENGNVLGLTTENLKPERTRSFEVGTKWDVLSGLALTAAAFYTQKTDARVLMADGNYANAGEFDAKGIELGAAGRISNKWQVFAGYTYIDSEQRKTSDALGNYQDLGAASNKGNALPGIAQNSASIWTSYDVLPKVTVAGGAFYMDKVYADPGNNVYVPSYVRWDAMAAYRIDKNLTLQLNLQNLTDERYFNQTYTRHHVGVAPGRLTFLSLNFKY